jgi:peptide/nickel transport system substrate-binding protein
MEVGFENWSTLYPQFINPNPPIVADVRFRKALLTAIDRQAMADAIQGGLAPVAHSYVRPDEPGSRETERFVVRYDYDPRRATQMIEELGYRKGPDGAFRDGAGQRLSVEVRATTSPAIHTKSLFPVVDYWQRLGIAAEPLVIPATRVRDPEFRGGTHPAFESIRHPHGPTQVQKLHSSEAPLPENRFVGRNRSRYINPEFDGLIDRYLTTIPWEPRMQVLGEIVHHISDQLNLMPLFYDLRITLVSNRLRNLSGGLPAWNAHEWEWTG